MKKNLRDPITIRDENGNEKQYLVEALFDVNGEDYALLQNEEDTILMKVEEDNGEQYLVGLDDPEKTQSLLDAYQIAVEANPAD